MGILLSTIWTRLAGSKEYKVVMVGLNNAGKTTILYKMHLGDVVETQPTIGSNVEEVRHRNIKFQVSAAHTRARYIRSRRSRGARPPAHVSSRSGIWADRTGCASRGERITSTPMPSFSSSTRPTVRGWPR